MTYQLKQRVKELLNRIAIDGMSPHDATAASRALLSELSEHEAEQKELREKYMIEMNKAGIPGEIEFDPDCIVSESDDGGAYIQAWVLVKSEG